MRGGLFNINASSTWSDKGIFAIGEEVNLPDYVVDYVDTDYGFDALGLGPINSPVVRFKSQTIGAMATKAFFLGSLGVNSQPTNFTAFTDSNIPLLSSLKESNTIKSLSFGYTAGARYRQNITGALSLGGYDASKFIPSNTSFQMAGDTSRDLVVVLKTIEFRNQRNSRNLLSKEIPIFIDSTVPGIWLPRDSCQLFEDAYGLEYNATLDRYLVNNTLHESLKSSNPSVSFVLQDSGIHSGTVNITLPYGSFDLELGYPYFNGSTQKYFPLHRADNETQYTLGRTFLQEAYLVVDYERKNFYVNQNAWTSNAIPQLVSIPALEGSAIVTRQTKHGMVAAVTTGAVIAVMAIIAILALVRRTKGQQTRKMDATQERRTGDDSYYKPEMDGIGKIQAELVGSNLDREAGSQPRIEMQGDALDLFQAYQYPLEAGGSRWAMELIGTLGGVEMASTDVAELEGHDNRWSVINKKSSLPETKCGLRRN